MKKLYFMFLMSMYFTANVYGQLQDTLDKHWPDYIQLTQYLQPFLSADTIYDELVLPISKDNELPQAKLLLPVKKVLKVTDAYLSKNFEKGRDWEQKGQTISLPLTSKAPFIKQDSLLFGPPKNDRSMESLYPNKYVLFSEGQLFRSLQLAITYIPDRRVSVPAPVYPKPGLLQHTLRKLKSKEKTHIVFYGNSIETGANSSGFQHVAPYMPNWTELIIYNLRQHYKGPITYRNPSVGGKMAQWGADEAAIRVVPEKPDLLVIGFGMNDGSAKVPPEQYIDAIKRIMELAKQANPSCEFILITPMLPNPDAIQNQIQAQYRKDLLSLENKGVAIADLTEWHSWLLQHKSYQDMTGNNVNHPNDYLARWYAQLISALLLSK